MRPPRASHSITIAIASAAIGATSTAFLVSLGDDVMNIRENMFGQQKAPNVPVRMALTHIILSPLSGFKISKSGWFFSTSSIKGIGPP